MNVRARLPAPSNRGAVISFCLILVLGVIGLVAAGLSDRRTTAFSIDVPAQSPVAMMAPGQSVCQGPLTVVAPFDGVTAWVLASKAARAEFVVTVRSFGGPAPALSTHIAPRSGVGTDMPTAISGSFPGTVASGRRISLCLQSVNPGVVDLLGNIALPGSGTLALHGRPTRLALALVFRSPHPASVLALIPTIFKRAALFRLPWLGAWTFWALLGGLLAAVVLMLVSLRSAASLDRDSRPGDG